MKTPRVWHAAGRWWRPWSIRIAYVALGAWLAVFAVVACTLWLAQDAWIYQAAGDRLNAGHQVYALTAGDRVIEMRPPYWTVPLLYPPPIAVIWRVLAALPFGIEIWQAAMMALLGAVVVVAIRDGRRWLVVLIAPMIGIEWAAGNVASAIVAVALGVGASRDSRWGLAVGLVAAIKIVPLALAAVFVARRDWRACVYVGMTIAVTYLVSILAVGIGPHLQYLGIVAQTAPQPWSASYLSGIAWLSPVVLVGGTLIACMARRRAHLVSVVTMIVGAPALSPVSLLPLLALGVGPADVRPIGGHPDAAMTHRGTRRSPAALKRG